MKETLATIHSLAETLGQRLQHCAWRVAVAESCTGGSLCAAITDISGCSAWFDRGFITYSNESKKTLLHVPKQTLITHGAVSEETALAMAHGTLKASHANLSVAITGIAGPDGGDAEKPVGTVWIAAVNTLNVSKVKKYIFEGNRQAIRHQAVFMALQQLIRLCA